ncbi:DUF3995 domain-containing protein [Streptomyces sp. NPDC041068]|uniref:DUF3995 domain-containing protein n=1 Tax=Streptomyces sp. NPDC041068 TaxID=3155130 RepID=UPI003403C764
MWWGRIACSWAFVFAGVHFYWALGGDVGLSVSAGPLATERPLWFVVAGLWGVGALCLVGARLAWLLARSRLRGVPARLARWLAWGVSALLLARGIGVEVLLLADATYLDASVSADQRVWTLALWNPGASPGDWPSASPPWRIREEPERQPRGSRPPAAPLASPHGSR